MDKITPDDMITIPIQATYRTINGEVVMVSAEYAEVSADAVARYLLDAFNVSAEKGAIT